MPKKSAASTLARRGRRTSSTTVPTNAATYSSWVRSLTRSAAVTGIPPADRRESDGAPISAGAGQTPVVAGALTPPAMGVPRACAAGQAGFAIYLAMRAVEACADTSATRRLGSGEARDDHP